MREGKGGGEKPEGDRRRAEQDYLRLCAAWQEVGGDREGEGRGEGREEGDSGTHTIADCRAILDEHKIWQEGWRRQGLVGENVTASVKAAEEASAASLKAVDAWNAASRRHDELLETKPPLPPSRDVKAGACVETLQVVSWDLEEKEGHVATLDKALVEYDAILERWSRIVRTPKQGDEGLFNADCRACVGRKEALLQERKVVQKLMGDMTEQYGGREELVKSCQEARDKVAACVAARETLAAIQVKVAYDAWTCAWREAKADMERTGVAVRAAEAAATGCRRAAEDHGRFARERAEWSGRVAAARRDLRACIRRDLGVAEAQWTAWTCWEMAAAWSERDEVEARLVEVEARLAAAEVAQRRRQLRGIIHAYPHYVLDKDLAQKRAKLEAELRAAEERQEVARRGAEIIGVREVLKKIEIRRELLECLAHAIQGYTKWLYTERLAPLLERAVSGLLERVCEERPLALEAEWEDKARSFVWFLRDGTSRTLLQKASGFQRFIVGMAMRIAMSRLGICRAEYKQFFIDEGFTACDGENLEKVPDFLRSLLEERVSSGKERVSSGKERVSGKDGPSDKGYSSVVLATHLEELKSCGDARISIDRDALSGIGRVAVGSLRAVLHVPADKVKRGRPKKTLA